jgi:hypothetical protein
MHKTLSDLKKTLTDLEDVRGFISHSRSQYLFYRQKKARPIHTPGCGELCNIRDLLHYVTAL